LIPNIVKGRGITGAIRYNLGEGNDAVTKKRKTLAPGHKSRSEILGGQNFGFEIDSFEKVELARRIMEFNAAPENQVSRTRKCEKDCLHLSISWEAGQNPSRAEMTEAAQSVLKALGMENAHAVFFVHHDTPQRHVHIVASRIDPETGKTYSDTRDQVAAQAWAIKWERDTGQVSAARAQTHEIAARVQTRDIAGIVEHLTARNPTFTTRELDRVLVYGGMSRAEAMGFRDRILADREVIGLRETADDPVSRYTTRGILRDERAIQLDARALAGSTRFGVDKTAQERVAAAHRLNGEQIDALRHATGPKGFAIIAGQAGTGKSRALGAIRETYEGQGYRVIGLAWTNAVVQDMRQDGFKQATTIAAEMKRLEGGSTRWDARTVLVVDEAAMLSTKALAGVFSEARASGAKVILAGDDRQLGSIERGGMFTPLRTEFGAAELREVQRVSDKDQRAAFSLMHEGEFGPALKIFEGQGALNWHGTQAEAVKSLGERYAADCAADPDKRRFIFAYTNAQVDTLNGFARELAGNAGRLGPDHTLPTATGPQAFAAGDRIQFTGNGSSRKGKEAGFVNGAVGTVIDIGAIDGKPHMTVELDGKAGQAGKRLSFTVGAEAGEFDKFRHGYAGTIYKGQGRTLDQTYVYHSEHWRAASSYVALTRHREDVAVFVSRDVAPDRDTLARQMGRDDQKRAASGFVADHSGQLKQGSEASGVNGIPNYVEIARSAKQAELQQARDFNRDREGPEMGR